MDTVLQVTDARRRFGATVALDGATLELRRGECLGLLGPNGAGKTTLVRAIAGRVRLDGGELTLLDTPLRNGGASARVARQHLGLVPQEIALYKTLSPRENLTIFGQTHGVRGDDLKQRIDWALTWTGLADRRDQRTDTFSGGMKRRLNIACGVLHKPEVVLLDEPTVGVDPQSRQRIWDMLDELRHAGASLLLTTHQLDEAQSVCDRIVIIDHGRVIAAGTFDELVAQTVGSDRIVTLRLDRTPPADLCDGTLEITGERVQRRMADVAADLPPLLQRLRDAGYRIEDVRVEAPTLHSVFLHLTGRELRE